MAESRSHRDTAMRIGRKFGAPYNDGEGPDVKSPFGTIEVETSETVADAAGQLRGYPGRVYIAGTNQDAVNRALEVTDGTTIGVMDNQGNVVKPSTRKG